MHAIPGLASGRHVEITGSAEVRWFSPGSNTSVEEWFASRFPNAASETERCDDYWIIPEVDFAGIKLREVPRPSQDHAGAFNLEFKLREADLGVRWINGDIAGRVELWRKWSAQVPRDAEEYKDAFAGGRGNWNRVRKRRKLQRFEWTQEQLAPVTGSKRLAFGCAIEVTDLVPEHSVHAHAAWTSLAVEAFTSPGGPHESTILGRALDEFRDIPTSGNLRLEDSRGYPSWLRSLTHWA